jgi:hypothetical protein
MGGWRSTSRGFYLITGERSGDHYVATYLAQVNAMKEEVLLFAGDKAARAICGKAWGSGLRRVWSAPWDRADGPPFAQNDAMS